MAHLCWIKSCISPLYPHYLVNIDFLEMCQDPEDAGLRGYHPCPGGSDWLLTFLSFTSEICFLQPHDELSPQECPGLGTFAGSSLSNFEKPGAWGVVERKASLLLVGCVHAWFPARLRTSSILDLDLWISLRDTPVLKEEKGTCSSAYTNSRCRGAS